MKIYILHFSLEIGEEKSGCRMLIWVDSWNAVLRSLICGLGLDDRSIPLTWHVDPVWNICLTWSHLWLVPLCVLHLL